MNKKILIINANYYKKICQYLLDGALDYLKKNSDYEYDIIEIPGAFIYESIIIRYFPQCILFFRKWPQPHNSVLN